MSNRVFVILTTLIIIFAAVLRSFWLNSVPVSLYWDEAAMLADARAILSTGSDLHGESIVKPIYYSYGDYKMPVYIILATAAGRIVGVNELAVRLPNMVIGILTMLVIAYIGRKLFLPEKSEYSKSFYLITLLLTAITPWHFHFSRVGFEAFLGQFFLGLSIAVLLSKLSNKIKYIVVPLIGALGVYSYFSVRFVWPVVFILGVFLVYKWQKRSNIPLKQLFLGATASLIIFMAALIPLFTSDKYAASNQFRYSTDSLMQNREFVLKSNVYRELAGNTGIDRVFFHRELLRIRGFAVHLSSHLSPSYLFLTGDSNLRHGTTNHGLFLLGTAPFLIVGLLQLFRHKKFSVLLFLIGWWGISLLPASVPYEVPHALRSLNALIPIALVVSYGALSVYIFAKERLQKEVFKSLLFISFVVLLSEFGAYLFYYYGAYPVQSANAWQSGYKEVVNAVYSQKNSAPIYILNTDRLYLWFLAFGPYTTEQFEKWENQLQDKNITFDSLHFTTEPEWESVPSGTALVTTLANQVELQEKITTANRSVTEINVIPDSLGRDRFVLLVLE